MKKIGYWKYNTYRKRWCDICNRPIKDKVLAIFYLDDLIYGDLVLCEECKHMLEEMLQGEEKVIIEWDFQGGG